MWKITFQSVFSLRFHGASQDPSQPHLVKCAKGQFYSIELDSTTFTKHSQYIPQLTRTKCRVKIWGWFVINCHRLAENWQISCILWVHVSKIWQVSLGNIGTTRKVVRSWSSLIPRMAKKSCWNRRKMAKSPQPAEAHVLPIGHGAHLWAGFGVVGFCPAREHSNAACVSSLQWEKPRSGWAMHGRKIEREKGRKREGERERRYFGPLREEREGRWLGYFFKIQINWEETSLFAPKKLVFALFIFTSFNDSCFEFLELVNNKM